MDLRDDGYARLMSSLLREMAGRERDGGSLYARLAAATGAAPATVAAWAKPSKDRNMPAHALLRLLSEEALTSEAGRRWLIDRVCEQAGGVFVELPDVGPDADVLNRQLGECVSRVGAAFQALNTATDTAGPGGAQITPGEWTKLGELLHGLVVEALQAQHYIDERLAEANR